MWIPRQYPRTLHTQAALPGLIEAEMRAPRVVKVSAVCRRVFEGTVSSVPVSRSSRAFSSPPIRVTRTSGNGLQLTRAIRSGTGRNFSSWPRAASQHGDSESQNEKHTKRMKKVVDMTMIQRKLTVGMTYVASTASNTTPSAQSMAILRPNDPSCADWMIVHRCGKCYNPTALFIVYCLPVYKVLRLRRCYIVHLRHVHERWEKTWILIQ